MHDAVLMKFNSAGTAATRVICVDRFVSRFFVDILCFQRILEQTCFLRMIAWKVNAITLDWLHCDNVDLHLPSIFTFQYFSFQQQVIIKILKNKRNRLYFNSQRSIEISSHIEQLHV